MCSWPLERHLLSLSLTPGRPFLAEVDLENAYYALLLPEELMPHFCLLPVAAGLVGVTEVDGTAVSPTERATMRCTGFVT